MKSMNNPHRFLSSVRQWFWGNPQPTRTYAKRLQAQIFGRMKPKRKVRSTRLFFPKSSPFWRHP